MLDFFSCITTWQSQAGRHDLPWQENHDPYHVWLSEIMLQQTQVNTVIGYYQRFLERFPNVQSLGRAEQAEVMPYWAGLGYYARARNLHRCAQIICQDYAGQFPSDPELLQQLPGIGKSTANAIAAFCFQASTPIMDGNVKRVFTRFYGITGTGVTTEKQLWQQAYRHAETSAAKRSGLGQYNQGLMDLGSSVCKRSKPLCSTCPLQNDCYAFKHNQQAELPTRKAKKAIPVRNGYLLILKQGSRVLLQTRPQQGIWGGLLSLPQYATEDELKQVLKRQGLAPSQKMVAFEHIFSHYRLIIHPQLLELAIPAPHESFVPDASAMPSKKQTHAIQSSTSGRNGYQQYPLCEPEPTLEGQWYSLDALEDLALPAPILKILQGLH